MKTLRNLALFASLVVACWGQATIQDRPLHISTGGGGTGNTIIASPTLISSGTSSLLNMGDSIQWHTLGGNGITPETRKDDGKGIHIDKLRASAVALKETDLAPISYASLARSIGVEVPADEADVLAAIHGADLHVYNYSKVDDYLYRAALRQGTNTRWVWKPMRESDVAPVKEAATWRIEAELGILYPKAYTRKIPMRVLLEAKAILEKLPSATFMVSDYEVIKPDPFLAISTPELLKAGKIWIIDQWDEPAFQDVLPATQVTALLH